MWQGAHGDGAALRGHEGEQVAQAFPGDRDPRHWVAAAGATGWGSDSGVKAGASGVHASFPLFSSCLPASEAAATRPPAHLNGRPAHEILQQHELGRAAAMATEARLPLDRASSTEWLEGRAPTSDSSAGEDTSGDESVASDVHSKSASAARRRRKKTRAKLIAVEESTRHLFDEYRAHCKKFEDGRISILDKNHHDKTTEQYKAMLRQARSRLQNARSAYEHSSAEYAQIFSSSRLLQPAVFASSPRSCEGNETPRGSFKSPRNSTPTFQGSFRRQSSSG
eukprot:Tamp_13073.p1 GENE.Tamp_13073~~Tamp_13073.p1  ORF type:complete len:281 (+),score=29.33 Tamp_13073:84-926(+)